jgi:hypothetical protein
MNVKRPAEKAAFHGFAVIFPPIVKWITFARTGPGNDALTGWRKPISISGQGKAAWASYSAGGLVFFAGIDPGKGDPTAPSTAIKRVSFPPGDSHPRRLVICVPPGLPAECAR